MLIFLCFNIKNFISANPSLLNDDKNNKIIDLTNQIDIDENLLAHKKTDKNFNTNSNKFLKKKMLLNDNTSILYIDKHIPLKKRRHLKEYDMDDKDNDTDEEILNVYNFNNSRSINKNEGIIKDKKTLHNFVIDKPKQIIIKKEFLNNNIKKLEDCEENISRIKNDVIIEESSLELNKKISKTTILENIDKISTSKDFLELFNILEKDFLNILKIALTYIFLENKYLEGIISKIENQKNYSQKIYNLMNIAQILLNIDFEFTKLLKFEKSSILNKILCNPSTKDLHLKTLKNMNKDKICKITVKIIKKELKVYDILKYTIYHIDTLTSNFIKSLCIFGFQNLFIYDLKNSMPRILNVLCLLYTYINEKESCNIKWQNIFIGIFSISFLSNKEYILFNNLIEKVFDGKKVFVSFRLYILLNSDSPDDALNCYENLRTKDVLQFQIINELIDLVYKTKVKMFNIDL